MWADIAFFIAFLWIIWGTPRVWKALRGARAHHWLMRNDAHYKYLHERDCASRAQGFGADKDAVHLMSLAVMDRMLEEGTMTPEEHRSGVSVVNSRQGM